MEYNDIMQKSDIENLKTDIWCLENIVQEQADRQRALEQELEDLKGQIETKRQRLLRLVRRTVKLDLKYWI